MAILLVWNQRFINCNAKETEMTIMYLRSAPLNNFVIHDDVFGLLNLPPNGNDQPEGSPNETPTSPNPPFIAPGLMNNPPPPPDSPQN